MKFIFLLILFALPNTQQYETQKFIMNYLRMSIRFEEILLNSLDLLQQKITNNTFKNEDILKLFFLKELILQTKQNRDKQRIKEQTVYWLLRQGR